MAETANKIKLVNNRVERAKSFLLYQFQDKANINKIVEALVEEIQEAENALIDLQTLRTLENAKGVQLDNIGDRLKVRRNNLDDGDYKTAIKVRILRRSNKGTKAEISNIFRLLTLDNNPIINNTHPYVVELTAVLSCIGGTSSGLDELLAVFPVNTGVRILNKPKRPFGFSGNPNAFPLSSTAFATPQGQMCSLMRTNFGIYDDPRFKKVETFIPSPKNLPVPTVPPFLSYTTPLVSGSVLTVNSGTWVGDPTITFLYQWFVNGNAVDGATNTTYTLLAGDINKPVHCRVIASNDNGSFTATTEVVTYTTVDNGGIVASLGLQSAYVRSETYAGALPIPALNQVTSIGLSFNSNGTVTSFNDLGTLTTVNYLETTGAGTGNNYEIQVNKVSGNSLTSPTQIDVWQELSTTRSFTLSITNPTYGFVVGSGTYLFTIRNKSTGVTTDKQVTFIVENINTNDV